MGEALRLSRWLCRTPPHPREASSSKNSLSDGTMVTSGQDGFDQILSNVLGREVILERRKSGEEIVETTIPNP